VTAKRRLPKPLLVAGGICLFLLSLVGVAYALTDIPRAASSLKENEAKAKAAGLFANSAEFVATLQVPESENGAPLLKEAIDLYEGEFKSLKYFGQDNKTMINEIVVSAYDKFDPGWQKVDELPKFKYCIFPRDRTPMIDTLFPEFSTIKSIAKLAQYRAVVALERNEPKVAAEAWRRGATLAVVCDDEPILIGLLVRIACESIVEESIRKALNQRGTDPAWRAAAWTALQQLDQPQDFAKAIKSEHVFALEGFDTLTRTPEAMGMGSGDMNNEWRLLRLFSKLPRAKDATNSRINEMYSEFYTRIGINPYDVKTIAGAGEWMDTEVNNKTGLSYTLVKILLPIFAQAGKACTKSYAQRNVLMQAVKLLENPSQKDLPLKGRYALDSDGAPLRMIWDQNRRIIYSIGLNYKDDGGIIERPKTGSIGQNIDYGVAIPK